MEFRINSTYKPTGDQPDAIRELVSGLKQSTLFQTLLGVTGSGKTFTMANVIEQIQKPTLVLSHNKTLAAQLFGEFRQFFPENAVEYFVSYYDYYQPEAYLPVTDTYIEKDLSINDEIEKLRLSTTSSLLSGRKDVIVVSSVSCLYGIGNPEDFHSNTVTVEKGSVVPRNVFLRKLVDSLYSRSGEDLKRGNFRVTGNTVDIFLAYSDFAYRIVFFGDEIEDIHSFDPATGKMLERIERAVIYPANIFITTRPRVENAIQEIQQDLEKQVAFFRDTGRHQEAKRLRDRVLYDIEMLRELGYCSGIENYSRYFDGRPSGKRPFCLLDYFPRNFLTIIDESHVTIPQIRGMYGGDHSRKQTLVEYGFRLPAALDNRPLRIDEFFGIIGQTIFVSATPADFELEKSEGVIVEQLIRPTGLVDPEIEVKPSRNQIDDLIAEIRERTEHHERILITTLTKRMAEELTDYLLRLNIRCRYIHSDIDTLERIEIMEGLRSGVFDVLVGVNLLREGLDLPEVALVAILDADKEGFLRSERSLTQTAGRAARNINGKVIMYADTITQSMKNTIEETNRRREKQLAYNEANNITPSQIIKAASTIMKDLKKKTGLTDVYIEPEKFELAADPVVKYMNREELEKARLNARREMEKAASELNFIEAARYRDEMLAYQELIEKDAKRNK
ncbi:MAG: excinuclease ABC subunit UvrB [Bacteroidales bacterium]|nr:excinuclease ABC subunit UvrB [Bacteroidales bacterium]